MYIDVYLCLFMYMINGYFCIVIYILYYKYNHCIFMLING